jgi:hypothetical protein
MKWTRIANLLAFAALLAVILFFTFRSSAKVSDLSWMPPRWGLWLDQHDEFRHFIGFAAFSAVTFTLNFDSVFLRSHSRFIRRFRSSANRTGRLGALLVMVYLLELAQLLLPHREFDWLDIMNGWAAVVVTWGIWFAIKSRRRRERRRSHGRPGEAINVSSVRFR